MEVELKAQSMDLALKDPNLELEVKVLTLGLELKDQDLEMEVKVPTLGIDIQNQVSGNVLSACLKRLLKFFFN